MVEPQDITSTVYVIDSAGSNLPAYDALFSSVHLQVEYFSSASEGVRSLNRFHRGCVVVDTTAPEVDGVSVLQQLRRRGVRLPVIVLSLPGDVAGAVFAMKSGCADYLEKPYSGQMLLDSVYEAMEEDWRQERSRSAKRELWGRLETLTPREWEVLLPMIRGRSNVEIAANLGVSPRTVEVYRSRVLAKSGAVNLPELIRIAMRLDLLSDGRAGIGPGE
ncbi:MAG: response regulator transcription factor [Ectothiorhodospiraceae bacterium]|nr:response regulator transcription factor [Ectothiorhodospiraceae bacterium]